MTWCRRTLTLPKTATWIAKRRAPSSLWLPLWWAPPMASLDSTPFSCSLALGGTEWESAQSIALLWLASSNSLSLSPLVYFLTPSGTTFAADRWQSLLQVMLGGPWLMTSWWLSNSGSAQSSPLWSSFAAVCAPLGIQTSEQLAITTDFKQFHF